MVDALDAVRDGCMYTNIRFALEYVDDSDESLPGVVSWQAFLFALMRLQARIFWLCSAAFAVVRAIP